MAFSGSDNLVHSLEQLAESQPSSLHEIPVFFLGTIWLRQALNGGQLPRSSIGGC